MAKQGFTKEIIEVAQYMAPLAEMKSSAWFCAGEAKRQYLNGHFDRAVRYALKSLAYSLGTGHSLYQLYATDIEAANHG
jgi:hypothetical protein